MLRWIVFFIFLISCTKNTKGPSLAPCPCKTIKLCTFYLKLNNYLVEKDLIDINDKYTYFHLINNVRNKKIFINPYQIWDLRIEDPSSRLVVDYQLTRKCIDSLFYKSPEKFEDARVIIYNFEEKAFGMSISDEILKRAAANMYNNPADWVTIHFTLWNAILEKNTEKVNSEIKFN